MELQARRDRFDAVAAVLIEGLRRYLARRVDPATAEDVLAEALLVCWRRFDEVPADLLPWSYGVARNCLANARRAERRRDRLTARIAVVDPPGAVAPPEPPDPALAAALASLPAADAELLRLWAWEDLGPAQIAAVWQISPNAAAIRLHRARRRLREVLANPAASPGHVREKEGVDRDR